MFRSKSVLVLAVVFLGGCIGNALDARGGDDEYYVAESEVAGLMAPRVVAIPPETEAADAKRDRSSSVNGKLPERPSLTPQVAPSAEPKPDAEAWAPDSPLREVFKEEVTLNVDTASGGAQ